MGNKQTYIILGIILMLGVIYFKLYQSGLFFQQAIVISNKTQSDMLDSSLVFNKTDGTETITISELKKGEEELYPFKIGNGEFHLKLKFMNGKEIKVSCGYTAKGATHFIVINNFESLPQCKSSMTY